MTFHRFQSKYGLLSNNTLAPPAATRGWAQSSLHLRAPSGSHFTSLRRSGLALSWGPYRVALTQAVTTAGAAS